MRWLTDHMEVTCCATHVGTLTGDRDAPSRPGRATAGRGHRSAVRRRQVPEQHVVHVREPLDVTHRRSCSSRVLRRLAISPGAAQPSPRSTPNPVSGSEGISL
jgi:hypothetical protein